VLAGLELDDDGITHAKKLISGRNIVDLRTHIAGTGDARSVDAIVELAMTRGRDDVLATARRLCHTDAGLAGVERLRSILARSRELGYGERINVGSRFAAAGGTIRCCRASGLQSARSAGRSWSSVSSSRSNAVTARGSARRPPSTFW
jgi:hypothetical protein